jgi:hypothetical protein
MGHSTPETIAHKESSRSPFDQRHIKVCINLSAITSLNSHFCDDFSKGFSRYKRELGYSPVEPPQTHPHNEHL